MNDFLPPTTDQARLHLDERYTTTPRARRTGQPTPRRRVARTLRAMADRLDG